MAPIYRTINLDTAHALPPLGYPSLQAPLISVGAREQTGWSATTQRWLALLAAHDGIFLLIHHPRSSIPVQVFPRPTLPADHEQVV
jgi:hypothetical protein